MEARKEGRYTAVVRGKSVYHLASELVQISFYERVSRNTKRPVNNSHFFSSHHERKQNSLNNGDRKSVQIGESNIIYSYQAG